MEPKTDSKFSQLLKNNKSLIPVISFVLLLVITIISFSQLKNPPYIESITPDVGRSGYIMVIKGENFGDTKNASEVIIGGIRPVLSAYTKWTDTTIHVVIPEEVTTGLVYIKTENGNSNNKFFANADLLPVVLHGPVAPGQPYIESIAPTTGNIGSQVTIKGLNLGLQHGTVLFSSSIGDSPETSFIACSMNSYELERWDEQEVTVYVPDGAVSGNVKIVTENGESNALYYEVRENSGVKQFLDKRGYQLKFTVTFENIFVDETSESYIDFWVPRGYNSLEQNVEALETSVAPLWEDFNDLGYMRFQLENPEPWRKYEYEFQLWLERYKVETTIIPSAVSSNYNKDRELFDVFTKSTVEIPSDDDLIVNLMRQAIQRNTHPYYKANSIYNYVIRQYTITTGQTNTSLIKALESKSISSETAALLTVAMLRATGIPARPVAGIFVTEQRSHLNHFWVEFYLEGIGWIPMDPALAAMKNLHLSTIANPVDYYFHNLDANHIAFSKGFADLKPLLEDSRTKSVTNHFSFQTFFEEVSNTVTGYFSEWSDVDILEYW